MEKFEKFRSIELNDEDGDFAAEHPQKNGIIHAKS